MRGIILDNHQPRTPESQSWKTKSSWTLKIYHHPIPGYWIPDAFQRGAKTATNAMIELIRHKVMGLSDH